MKTKYPHLQEVLAKIEQTRKEIMDEKAYKEKVIDGLGIQSFFYDKKIMQENKTLAGAKNSKTN